MIIRMNAPSGFISFPIQILDKMSLKRRLDKIGQELPTSA